MKKALSLILALLLVLNLGVFAMAAEGDAITLTADKSSAAIGETVKVTVAGPAFSNMSTVSMKLYYDGIAFELDSENSEMTAPFELGGAQSDKNGNYVTVSFLDFNGATSVTKGTYAVVAFTVLAQSESAEFSLGGQEVCDADFEDVAVTMPESGVTVETTEEPAAPAYEGYGVSVSGDKSITAGEVAEVSVTVANSDANVNGYNAYDLSFSYDAEKLEYAGAVAADADAEVKAENGVITVRGYGAEKALDTAAVTLKFTAKATGETAVELTAAKVDISANAISKDAPDAEILDSEAVITVSGYSVSLGEYLSGSAVAAPGEDYTFTATEYANYGYEVTATVNGAAVKVLDNQNGTYTIAGDYVTGNITVTAVLTARSYTVTITGEDVTGAETATYNTPYSFTVDKQPGYTYSVAVKIGGVNYAGYSAEGNVYTIPGTDITDDIEITVAKTVIPATQVSVTFDGTGAGDAKGNETAKIGEDYIFTVEKAEGYSYEVTAKIGEEPVEITEADGTYTIAGADVTGDIVITVAKTEKITVKVDEYLTVDEQAMNYVTVKGELAEGKVAMYDGKAMYWSEKYDAYVYLVIGAADASLVTIGDGEAVSVDYSGNVNGTEVIDINDAQLVYDIYNAKYANFDAVSMYKFLCADVNGDMEVNTLDAAAVVAEIQ